MMKHYAAAHEDGNISIIFCQDIERHLERTPFASPVAAVEEVTEEQAAVIRCKRPKPPVPESSTQVPQVNIAEIQVIQQENAQLRAELEDVRSQVNVFGVFVSELKKALEAKQGA